MSLPNIESKQYPAEILTEHYHLKCVIEPLGKLMTYLDTPERNNILIKNITLTGLANDSVIGTINIKELWLTREEIIFIRVNENDVKESLKHLPAKETLRIFVPNFVVQGTISRGEDTREGDIFDALIGDWAAIHDAQVFPLSNIKAQVFKQASMVLVNKKRIEFYEPM